jgi:hypothetical protein
MSATIAQKLQIKAGQKLLLLNPPTEVMQALTEQLPENEVTTTLSVPGDAVLFFSSTLAEVALLFSHAVEALLPGGLLWIAYRKGSDTAVTDINRDRLAEMIEPSGWLPVRQVALDEAWSAMRFRPKEEVGK